MNLVLHRFISLKECYWGNRDYVSFTDKLILKNEPSIMMDNDLLAEGNVFLWNKN